MLRFAFIVTSFALALGAPSGVGDLQVSLKPVASSVQSIKDIIITATVSNPTSQDIRVPTINNVLDTSSTQSFIVSKDDKEVSFTGIRAIFDMSAEGVYKVIPAGSSLEVNHTNLAPLYDFQSSGIGKFTFSPRPLFLTRMADANKLTTTDIPIVTTIDVAGDVLRRTLNSGANKSTASCANKRQFEFIKRTLDEAIVLARDTATDVNKSPASKDLKKYFKTNKSAEIQRRFEKIAADADKRVISCVDKDNICNDGYGTIAYTTLMVDSRGRITASDIYTCPIFYTNVKRTSSICKSGYDLTTSSDGGIILHELSHANSKTKDVTYDCSDCEGLSASDQLENADNYRCLSLAVYKRTKCPK